MLVTSKMRYMRVQIFFLVVVVVMIRDYSSKEIWVEDEFSATTVETLIGINFHMHQAFETMTVVRAEGFNMGISRCLLFAAKNWSDCLMSLKVRTWCDAVLHGFQYIGIRMLQERNLNAECLK